MSSEPVMPPTAWELYHSCFKEGEEVIVITDGENYYWGKLETVGEEGCRLHRAEVKDPPLLKWEDVSFISHDGFPIRKLQGADGSRAIEKIDTTDTQGAVRAILTKDTCSECDTLVEVQTLECKMFRKKNARVGTGRRRRLCPACRVGFVVGDPYQIEPCHARLWYPGNNGPEHWVQDDEEIIVLRADDGAMANLWDVQWIFHMEVA